MKFSIITAVATALVFASIAAARVAPRTASVNETRAPAYKPRPSKPLPSAKIECGDEAEVYTNASARKRSVSIQLTVNCGDDDGDIYVRDAEDVINDEFEVSGGSTRTVTVDVPASGDIYVECGTFEQERGCCTYAITVH